MPTLPFEFTEIEGSPKESASLSDGSKGTREFRCAWGDRRALRDALLYGGTGGLPMHFPGVPGALCVSVSIAPANAQAPTGVMTDPELHLAEYDNAIVTASYQSASRQTAGAESRPDGTWVTYDGSGTVELLTVPSRAMYWADNNTRVSPEVNGGILIPITRHTLTWHNVAVPPWLVISTTKGLVNASEFLMLAIGMNCPAETLLFSGYTTRVQAGSDGSAKWEVSYSFDERRITQLTKNGDSEIYGWNHTYRDRPPHGWYRTYSTPGVPENVAAEESDKVPPYRLGDLSALFEQPGS